MNKEYTELHFMAGTWLKDVVSELLRYKDNDILACYNFNDYMLYSDTVDMDDAYMAITGMTKREFDKWYNLV